MTVTDPKWPRLPASLRASLNDSSPDIGSETVQRLDAETGALLSELRDEQARFEHRVQQHLNALAQCLTRLEQAREGLAQSRAQIVGHEKIIANLGAAPDRRGATDPTLRREQDSYRRTMTEAARYAGRIERELDMAGELLRAFDGSDALHRDTDPILDEVP